MRIWYFCDAGIVVIQTSDCQNILALGQVTKQGSSWIFLGGGNGFFWGGGK